MSYSPKSVRDNFTKWTPAIAIYYRGQSSSVSVRILANQNISITDGSVTISTTYANRNIRDIVASINAATNVFDAVALVDIGPENMLSGGLVCDEYNTDRSPDGAYLIRYTGHTLRYDERNVIQLKPPFAKTQFESWFARIGKGKFNAKFSDVTFTSYPGITPNAIYTFSIPEYINQDWSVLYGAPYKDIFGEVSSKIDYNSNLSTTVVQLARTPVFYHKGNISISLNGVRQPNSCIKYVDENNGLVFLNTKIDPRSTVAVDYTYKSSDYEYDGIDLNASIAHNPLIIDAYIAYYLKPSSCVGAAISGGRAIYHEIVNTEVAGRHRVAKAIPSTLNSNRVLYEPVLYLGSISIRQVYDKDSIEVIDTRSRGGGIAPGLDMKWRESEFYYDIGFPEGKQISGNAAVVINVPHSIISRGMSNQEAETRVKRSVALGVVPIVNVRQENIKPELEFYYNEDSGWLSIASITTNERTIEFDNNAPAFYIQIFNSSGNKVFGRLDPTSFYITHTASANGHRHQINLVYKSDSRVRIRLVAERTADGFAFSVPLVHNTSSTFSVSAVEWPVVGVKPLGNPDNFYLAHTVTSGSLCKKPHLSNWSMINNTDNMQWLAYFDSASKDILYFQTDDTTYASRYFGSRGMGTYAICGFVHNSNRIFRTGYSWSKKYKTYMRVLKGQNRDGRLCGHDAALEYRKWAATPDKPWRSRGPWYGSDKISPTIHDCDLFISNTYDGNYENINNANLAAKATGDIPRFKNIANFNNPVYLFYMWKNYPALVYGAPDPEFHGAFSGAFLTGIIGGLQSSGFAVGLYAYMQSTDTTYARAGWRFDNYQSLSYGVPSDLRPYAMYNATGTSTVRHLSTTEEGGRAYIQWQPDFYHSVWTGYYADISHRYMSMFTGFKPDGFYIDAQNTSLPVPYLINVNGNTYHDENNLNTFEGWDHSVYYPNKQQSLGCFKTGLVRHKTGAFLSSEWPTEGQIPHLDLTYTKVVDLLKGCPMGYWQMVHGDAIRMATYDGPQIIYNDISQTLYYMPAITFQWTRSGIISFNDASQAAADPALVHEVLSESPHYYMLKWFGRIQLMNAICRPYFGGHMTIPVITDWKMDYLDTGDDALAGWYTYIESNWYTTLFNTETWQKADGSLGIIVAYAWPTRDVWLPAHTALFDLYNTLFGTYYFNTRTQQISLDTKIDRLPEGEKIVYKTSSSNLIRTEIGRFTESWNGLVSFEPYDVTLIEVVRA